MKLRFAAFEVDTGTRELRRDGALVPMEPKAFDVLVLLAANHSRVVSKEELNEAVWHGRIVSDAALDTCIKTVRRAVGDDGRAQRIIRTVPRRGFRFVATPALAGGPVLARGAAADASAGPVSPGGRGVESIGEVRHGAVGDGPEVGDGAPPALPDRPSIAVLPFERLNPAADRHGVAEGLVRDITTRLGRARWLFVIARGSAAQLLPGSTSEAAVRLGVRYVLQGSLQVCDDRVRVNAALVDTVAGAELWASIIDRRIDDVFAVQDEIAEAVVGRVHGELEAAERRRALLKPIAGLSAWSAYHRACWHLDQHTATGYDHAEALFLQAVRLDPGCARALAGLSYVHRQRAFLELTGDRAREVEQTYDLAGQSLALDPGDAQAHWVMGRALMLRNEVEPALASFRTATELNPSFAMGRYSVGLSSAMLGQSAASDSALVTACRLSPLDPLRFAMIATQAFNAAREGDPDRAVALVQLAAGQPNAHFHIVALAALCNALAGRMVDARRHREQLAVARPGYVADNFFRAFPFQCSAHLAMWRRGFRLLGSQ